MGINVRYLERSGSSRPDAMSTVSLGVAAGFAMHLVMIVGLLGVASQRPAFRLGALPNWTVGAASIIAVAAAALAAWHWQIHTRVLTAICAAATHARSILHEPRRVIVLGAASAGISLSYGIALTACLVAVGGHVRLTDVVLVYLAGSALGAVAPVPAGIGAVEAALIAGVSHLGVHPSVAVAGVLSDRMVTYWLPVLPGFCAPHSSDAAMPSSRATGIDGTATLLTSTALGATSLVAR